MFATKVQALTLSACRPCASAFLPVKPVAGSGTLQWQCPGPDQRRFCRQSAGTTSPEPRSQSASFSRVVAMGTVQRDSGEGLHRHFKHDGLSRTVSSKVAADPSDDGLAGPRRVAYTKFSCNLQMTAMKQESIHVIHKPMSSNILFLHVHHDSELLQLRLSLILQYEVEATKCLPCATL